MSGTENYTHITSCSKTHIKYRNVCSCITDWVARLIYINNLKSSESFYLRKMIFGDFIAVVAVGIPDWIFTEYCIFRMNVMMLSYKLLFLSSIPMRTGGGLKWSPLALDILVNRRSFPPVVYGVAREKRPGLIGGWEDPVLDENKR